MYALSLFLILFHHAVTLDRLLRRTRSWWSSGWFLPLWLLRATGLQGTTGQLGANTHRHASRWTGRATKTPSPHGSLHAPPLASSWCISHLPLPPHSITGLILTLAAPGAQTLTQRSSALPSRRHGPEATGKFCLPDAPLHPVLFLLSCLTTD
jgi:hypothetical protein